MFGKSLMRYGFESGVMVRAIWVASVWAKSKGGVGRWCICVGTSRSVFVGRVGRDDGMITIGI